MIQEAIISSHKNGDIAIDIMFVNGIPFLVTISRHVKFGTAEMFLLPKKMKLHSTHCAW